MSKKILIIKTSSLGNIIHALPVLDYLHKVMPGIEIDWVVEEEFRDVLQNNPLIANLRQLRSTAWQAKPFSVATFREISHLKSNLQARQYDLVFDIQGNLKSSLVCWLSGASDRTGFSKEFLQESINALFTTRQVSPRRQDYHMTDQYLRLVSVPFGRDFRDMKLHSEIFTSPEEDAAAEALLATLADGLVFLFHCGTTSQTQCWSDQNWILLGQEVLARYPESSLLLSWGTPAERNTAVSMVNGIGDGARITAPYTLTGFAALLKKVDVVIGGDTGPVHIAAAVGTPTVSFYRASDGKRSGPRGPGHVVIQSPLHCSKCFRTECDKDPECRASITVEMMIDGIEKALE